MTAIGNGRHPRRLRPIGREGQLVTLTMPFGVLGACQIVEKSAGYQDLPLEVRHGVGQVDKGRVATKRLTFDEGGRYAASFRGGGSREHLCWKDEEPVGIADC